MAELAFYCMSSDAYFPGAVAMINSLRLQGHREPIFLLDCGLSDAHRELLAGEATIVPGPSEEPPFVLKTLAPVSRPAATMVLIDVDMVATRPLGPLIEQARGDGVVAFKDNIDRFVPEWGDLLELGPANPRPYVSSGLVVLAGATGAEALSLWHERRDHPDYELSWFKRRVADYPLLFLDQDLLNAVLCTRVPEEHLVVADKRLAPHQPYRGLRIVDETRLACAYRDGSEPFVLHQYLAKPWLEPMYHGIYSRMLSRLWLGDDVAIRFPEEEIPLRMREGLRARLVRKRVDVQDLARWYARDVIPEWIAARRGGTA